MGDGHARLGGGPAAQVARWPPAEWPRVTTVEVSSPSTSASASIAAATSSKVSGSAAAVADPAVLDVPRGPARVGERRGERLAEGAVVRRLPEPAVDHHDDAAGVARRAVELDELLRVVAVRRSGRRTASPGRHRRPTATRLRRARRRPRGRGATDGAPVHARAAGSVAAQAARSSSSGIANWPSTATTSPPVRPSSVRGTPWLAARAVSRSTSPAGTVTRPGPRTRRRARGTGRPGSVDGDADAAVEARTRRAPGRARRRRGRGRW